MNGSKAGAAGVRLLVEEWNGRGRKRSRQRIGYARVTLALGTGCHRLDDMD